MPEAKAGTEIVLVMDNLHEVHKMKRVRQLIEGHGCELLVVLPSYSPDSKWDEKAKITLRMEPTMMSVGES